MISLSITPPQDRLPPHSRHPTSSRLPLHIHNLTSPLLPPASVALHQTRDMTLGFQKSAVFFELQGRHLCPAEPCYLDSPQPAKPSLPLCGRAIRRSTNSYTGCAWHSRACPCSPRFPCRHWRRGRGV